MARQATGRLLGRVAFSELKFILKASTTMNTKFNCHFLHRSKLLINKLKSLLAFYVSFLALFPLLP